MSTFEKHEYKGHKYKIRLDEHAPNPFEEWDGMPSILTWMRNDVSTIEKRVRPEDYTGWEELEEAVVREYDAVAILPLFKYEHGGVAFNTTGFSCPWDSGQAGFIFYTRDTVKEMNDWKRISKQRHEKMEEWLVGEVQLLEDWYNGNVYGWVYGNDSCWGYFGNSGLEQIHAEVRSMIDRRVEREKENV